ncbi:hypothetical protein PMI16_03179 [Herbaspirillum sp. CF444]|nr:hypothetical protein PMI16_03179 [Herbaspirillum sp. CF444]
MPCPWRLFPTFPFFPVFSHFFPFAAFPASPSPIAKQSFSQVLRFHLQATILPLRCKPNLIFSDRKPYKRNNTNVWAISFWFVLCRFMF